LAARAAMKAQYQGVNAPFLQHEDRLGHRATYSDRQSLKDLTTNLRY
jgi:hypothetical protein